MRAEAEARERAERAEAAARRQREADAKAEAERKAKADAQQAEKAEKEAVEAAAATEPEPGSAEFEWIRWMTVIQVRYRLPVPLTPQTIKREVLPAVSADKTWSMACRQAKRTMTTRVGQVTNEAQQIRDVVRALSSRLR